MPDVIRAVLLSLLCAVTPIVAAQSADEKGLGIAQEIDRRDTGWGDHQATVEMVLQNRQGQESRRKLRIRTLEIEGDGDRSLTVFDSPRDIAGTAFLSYTHALIPDDQWLYLPALKRVKRIASANKSGPFVGSEFAYEDLSSNEVQKYHYRWVRDEPLGDHPTHVLEEQPAYEHSGYTRRVVWIAQSMMQPLKVEFYDRKNALLKTLECFDYVQYLERYWRPTRMTMLNHQTGKRTELHWSEYRFRSGLSARDFDQNTLKRVR